MLEGFEIWKSTLDWTIQSRGNIIGPYKWVLSKYIFSGRSVRSGFFFFFSFFEKNGSPLKFRQFKVTRVISLSNVILPKHYSLDKYFKIFTIKLHVLYVFNIHVKFCTNQMSIMSSIKYLNFKFYILKLCIKDEFMDQLVNSICLMRNLACLLKR